MPIILKNNASSPLTASITASDTGFVVADGNQFPTLSAGEYFYATLVSTAGTLEIVKVTARAGNSLSVVRAQDGSSAASFAAGTLVEMRVNAASVIDLVDEHDEAAEIRITDAGGFYTSDNVEGALQEAMTRADLASDSTGKGATLVTLADPGGYYTATTVEGVLQEIGAAGGVVGVTTAVDRFTGDGTTTTFTLSAVPLSANLTDVYIDGVYQNKDTFSFFATTLTFSEAPPLGSSIEVLANVNAVTGTLSSSGITYNQGGAGAVSRTVTNKLQEFVSVKDFGAVGDGVTDDTAAIQAAIDAIANTNRVLTGGGLTYNITSQLLVSGTASFNLRDITLSYSGASTNAPLKIDRGGDQYTSGSLQNVAVLGNGGAALVGIQTRKALRQTWINVGVAGFTASGAVGVTLEGSTSNRFFDCGFTGNYIGMKTLNFINASNGVYVPANENKFFGCTWFGCTSDGMQMLGDAAAGGIQSTGNGNGFHACWFEDNGGICLNIENSGDTTIDDCRFESGTGYNMRFEPTMGANIRRHTRILNSNFTGLTAPIAHLLIGANALGAQVMGNKFSGGGVTAWINNSSRTTFLQNNSDGGVDFDNKVSNFESLAADAVSADAATIDQLSLTSRGNGNNWTSVTVTANAITYSDTLLVCQTNSTTISTINGGVNGDVLMIKGNTSAGTATTLVSGGNIRLPSGVTPALTFFSVATLINDGNGRWLLVSFSNNV